MQRHSPNLLPWLFLALGCVAPASAGAPYSIAFSGSRHVYAGHDVYLTFSTVSTIYKPLIFNSITLPAGFSHEYICAGLPSCWTMPDGRKYQYQGAAGKQTILLRIKTTRFVAPGVFPVWLHTEMDGVKAASLLTIIVSGLSPASSLPPSISGPGIPGKAKWESTMTTVGAKWCNPSQVFSFGDETTVWYYDGARVYYQLADYTKNSAWTACALNVARQYRDYVLQYSGRVPGWRVFPHGLLMAWKLTGDVSFRTALDLLARQSAYATSAGKPLFTHMRETAYILQTYIAAEKAGFPRNPLMARAASNLMAHFVQVFQPALATGLPAGDHGTWADGLAAAALIEYYELTRDPRVPAVIKIMLDWTWTNAWSETLQKLMINPAPSGPNCSWGCRQYNTDLINLSAAAWAWYWQHTGDGLYQWRGDQLFSHALDTDISYSGKIFSQNYRWSFNYVRWRETVR